MSLIDENPHHIKQLIRSYKFDDRIYQQCELANSKQPGYSGIYRNRFSTDRLIASPHPNLTTINEIFEYSVKNNPQTKCFGKKIGDEYVFDTYEVIELRRRNLGAGIFWCLANNHVNCKIYYNSNESFILSMFSANRPEWSITDLACNAYSITNTALYDTLGSDTTRYILGITNSPVVVASQDKILELINLKRDFPEELNSLIVIISMDNITDELVSLGHTNNLSVYDFKTVEKLGELNPLPLIPPKPSTNYTISFTSGTTGANPKGVVLTNGNAVAAMVFCLSQVTPEDNLVFYSFLPLAHIYERMNLLYYLFVGGTIGYVSKSPTSLFSDVAILKPHYLSLVPRVFTKLEALIKSQTISNPNNTLRRIFTKVINEKMILQSGNDIDKGSHIVYDRLLAVLRKKLGFDRLISFNTGSAPIAPETMSFLKASCNVGFSQGYGLTESFAGVCSSPKYEANPGSCGAITLTTEMKLREIPEMNYYADDPAGPKGELLIRGYQNFIEYYKDPEETAKAIDSEGWFSTGDVAMIDLSNHNRLYIIDRVKNFFKLAQGEYITPERIENIYLACNPALQQVYVHGNSLKTYLVAIVGLEEFAAPILIKKLFNHDISKKEEIIEFFNKTSNKKKLLQYLNSTVQDKLVGFEKIHNLKVMFNPLTIEDNLITPTLKIKRPMAFKFYKSVFEDLYEEGSILDASKL